MYVCVCVCVRERKQEKKKEKKRERDTHSVCACTCAYVRTRTYAGMHTLVYMDERQKRPEDAGVSSIYTCMLLRQERAGVATYVHLPLIPSSFPFCPFPFAFC